VSDRQKAILAYQAKITSSNPSTFDTLGEFNKYYQKPAEVSSYALPIDFATAIPQKDRAALIQSFNPTTRSFKSEYYDARLKQYMPAVPGEAKGFWQKTSETLEKGYNLAAQAVVFGLGVADENNPLWKGQFDIENIRKSWQEAGKISPGQMMLNTIAQGSIGVFDKFNLGLGDEFIKENLLFGSNNFNIYDGNQRKAAFEEQTAGRVGSWFGDVVSRFVIDPFVIAGKGVQVYRAGRYAFKSADEFGKIISGAEDLTKRQQRLKGTFNDFLERTDGMVEQDFFRIKAVRESSNPGIIANLLTTANKIEDKTARHAAKTNIIHMAMGDEDAFVQLANQSDLLAAQVASLRDEVPQMKFLTGKPAEDGQMSFNYMNDGAEYEKHIELIKEYEEDIAKIHKNLALIGSMDPKKVPFVDLGSDIRRTFVNSQNFIDFRSNSGTMVRFHTGFFYKRPRGWIDYTDNQSVQTIDNQLSRVVGLSDRQRKVYETEIDILKSKIDEASKLDPKNGANVEKVKDLKQELARAEARFKKSTSFTVERRNELFAKYAGAVDADERAFVHAEIERELFSVVAKQFGYSDFEVSKAYSLFANKRQQGTNLIKERLYTGAIDPKTGGPVGAKPVMGEDGVAHVFSTPINETQLAKQMPTLDIDTMYKVLKRATRAEMVKDATTGAPVLYNAYSGAMRMKNATGDLADALDQFLKFQVLARLGYPVRNLTEGNLRVFSVLGAWTMLETAAQGSMNKIANLLSGGKSKNAADDVLELAERAKLEAQRNKLLAARELVDDPNQIDAEINEIDRILNKEKLEPNAQYGIGEIEILGLKLQDAKGLTPEQAAYYNDKFVASAGQVVDTSLSQVKDSISNSMQLTGDFVRVNGRDANYAEAYLRVVNRQVKGSKIGRKFLEGSTVDEVEMWLQTSDEGRRILRPFTRMGKTARELAEENFENTRHLLPNDEMRQLLLKRNFNEDDIVKFFGDNADSYPSVNGAQTIEALGGNYVTQMSSKVANAFYKWAGEVPESKLVRSPLYVNLYRRRLNALVEQAIETTKGDMVDSRYLRSLENKARQWARAEMRRTVYDVAEKTDAAYTLKYVFPFFGAFSDVAEKWLRIGLNNPAALRKLQIAYESPDRNGMTEERDGLTYINIPAEWAKRMSLGIVDRPLQIPKASLNLIFQGGAWWNPGAGWFAQFAASEIVSRYPQSEKTRLVSEILPYGAQDRSIRDLVVQSAAARKALALMNEEDPMRSRLTVLVMAEENAKYDQGLRDTPPTKKEVNDKVMKILALEVATRLVLPFATNTRSPYQFYIDEYQKLRRENPDTAADVFYNRYGADYFYFTTSLSKNNTGISATLSAYERSQQLSDLIAENPEYGWFLVGDANAGEFSPTIYGNQFEDPVAPGSTINYRGRKDPYEAIEETQAGVGWKEYRKGIALLEAERINRGLKTLSAAPDLVAAKAEFVENLSNQYPGWGKAYGDIDIESVNKFLRTASKWVQDPRLAGRQDMKTFSDYLEGRRIVREELAKRQYKSINAQANADLREAWDIFVGDLLDQDVTFERIYTRILEKDDLTKGF
jgi:hypothetical protein